MSTKSFKLSRLSLKTRCVWFGVFAILSAINAPSRADGPSASITSILATYYPKSRAEVFSLVVDYGYSRISLTTDKESTRISNLRLYVRRSSVNGAINWKPLELPFSQEWAFEGIATTPLWPKGYIARPDYILPTGEFFNSASSGLCCIIFDGSFRLFQFDAAKGAFSEKTPTAELTAELGKWYGENFKVDDVYWSYGIVTQPQFFGKKGINLSASFKTPPICKIDELYTAWQQIAAK